MMLKPKAEVRVIIWAKCMRMKRRFEVQISDGDDEDNDGMSSPIAIARFESLDRAEAFASALVAAVSTLRKDHGG